MPRVPLTASWTRFLQDVDLSFYERHVVSGFGSGEALIASIRDLSEAERDKGVQSVEKRRVIDEPEILDLD